MRNEPSPPPTLLDWLLDTANPSARYLTLRDLLDDGRSDPAAAEARSTISAWGPVQRILAAMDPREFWGRFRRPLYGGALSTQATLNLLAELGLPPNPQIQEACEHLITDGQHTNGGFDSDPEEGAAPLCYTGIAVRTLLHFGYAGDPRLDRAINYLVERASLRRGLGCQCCADTFCGWGIAKALTAFAALPAGAKSPGRAEAAQRMANTLLDHGMDFEGRDVRWLELGFPLDYQSDLAELCDALSGLGWCDPVTDARFARLLDALLRARSPAGLWTKHFGTRVLQIERRGAPSKWITIRALRALKRSGRAGTDTVHEILRGEKGE
jgi:hypothetical protein